MAVKANQPALYDDVKLLMDDPAAPADDTAETVDGDHGRIETRRAEVLHDVDWLTESHHWPGLATLGKVTATREVGGRATTTSRYYIASRSLSAAELNRLVRGHWGIENAVHWVRDVTFDEDRCTVRTGTAPQVMASLRNTAINLHRLHGADNIAEACRRTALSSDRGVDLLTDYRISRSHAC